MNETMENWKTEMRKKKQQKLKVIVENNEMWCVPLKDFLFIFLKNMKITRDYLVYSSRLVFCIDFLFSTEWFN